VVDATCTKTSVAPLARAKQATPRRIALYHEDDAVRCHCNHRPVWQPAAVRRSKMRRATKRTSPLPDHPPAGASAGGVNRSAQEASVWTRASRTARQSVVVEVRCCPSSPPRCGHPPAAPHKATSTRRRRPQIDRRRRTRMAMDDAVRPLTVVTRPRAGAADRTIASLAKLTYSSSHSSAAGVDGARADAGRGDVEKGRRSKSPGRLTRRSEAAARGAGGGSSPPPPRAAERRDGHREATVGDGGVEGAGDAVTDEPVMAVDDGEVNRGDGGADAGTAAAAAAAASGHASAAAQGVMDDGERARPGGGGGATTGEGGWRATAAASSLASICRRRRRSCAPSTATGKPVPRATTVTRRPMECGARRPS